MLRTRLRVLRNPSSYSLEDNEVKIVDKIKTSIKNWLNIPETAPYSINIQQLTDFETNAIRNRIWYRGDGSELAQMYSMVVDYDDRYKFWACRPSAGMEMRKIHTGLPSLIVNTLTGIVMADFNAVEFSDEHGNGARAQEIWDTIEDENSFREALREATSDVLVVGDGAFKITIDSEVSEYPIIEWYSGETVEFSEKHGRLSEVIFRTPVKEGKRDLTLVEHYGYGYIENELYDGDKNIEMGPELQEKYRNFVFDKKLMMAVPFKVKDSAKYKGRGGSLYDSKIDSFDAFDEAWSQWMDALRKGRAIRYIPENMIPRNPDNGELMHPNPFDNSFIKVRGSFSESGESGITVQQPAIPHDSYMATYITALDLCLQGLISPSTLGIDTKKLDNAEAQREKEKTTLYTRNQIVEAIQNTVPLLAAACVNSFYVLNQKGVEDFDVSVTFGEYANPSFESQIETVAKGRQGGIMSIEASVDELYGDTKEDDWKKAEVERLKQEQGVAVVEETALNLDGIDYAEELDI